MKFTKMINRSLNLTILLAALLSLSACSGLAVRGSVGGQTIDSRVDSEVARYYLASYLAGKHTNAALDERIDRVYQSVNGSLPDRGELKRLRRPLLCRSDRARTPQSALSKRL